jgi:hypothetical protein
MSLYLSSLGLFRSVLSNVPQARKCRILPSPVGTLDTLPEHVSRTGMSLLKRRFSPISYPLLQIANLYMTNIPPPTVFPPSGASVVKVPCGAFDRKTFPFCCVIEVRARLRELEKLVAVVFDFVVVASKYSTKGPFPMSSDKRWGVVRVASGSALFRRNSSKKATDASTTFSFSIVLHWFVTWLLLWNTPFS